MIRPWEALSADEKVALVKPYVEGGFSAVEVASALNSEGYKNLNKNKIISVCRRNGLRLNAKPGAKKKPKRKQSKEPEDRASYGKDRADLNKLVSNENGVPFLEIAEYGQCRRPLWSTSTPLAEKMYCGKPTQKRRNMYCDDCGSKIYLHGENEAKDLIAQAKAQQTPKS